MPDSDVSLTSRTSAALARLQASAKQFKPVSATLSKFVRQVEQALDELDLRVACYTQISESRDSYGDDSFTREYIGYIEHQGRWQIVLNVDEGFDSRPGDVDEKIWPFDLSPQYLRIKAVDKLPELIDSLAATLDKTSQRMAQKLEAAQEIASAVTSLSKKKVSR
jgi:hypothetical protein